MEYVIVVLIPIFMIFAFIVEWLERKFVARMQSRIGPLVTGPKGFLQPLADFLKLMSKEEITPTGADKLLLTIIPILQASLVTFSLMFIPIFSPEPILSYPGDLIFIIGLSAIFATLIVLTGYVTPSPYAIVGSARYAELTISFEISYVLSIASAALIAGSTIIADIARFQTVYGPIFIYAPLGFVIMLISTMAKTERVPFDIAEAETEIAGGWQVELSGRRLAFYRLSMDLELLLAISLCVALYLGGGYGPFVDVFGPIMYFVWFLVKLIILVFIVSLVEAIMARYRIDHVLRGFWKAITPLAVLQALLAVIVRAYIL
ncbi:MAG: complex I subunit 1/NuoH family protein [Candidatus Njordarchaeales archaeon]